MKNTDVIIVGSGCSGALAARWLVEQGLNVLMVDAGRTTSAGDWDVPDEPFSRIRQTDKHQSRYFLGPRLEGVPEDTVKTGSQLTPPRQFIVTDADRYLPSRSDSFFPMQTLAFGGLGAGWGAGCFGYSDEELVAAGLPPGDIRDCYGYVARIIGISGDPESDNAASSLVNLTGMMPPLELDSNAETILAAYQGKRQILNRQNFHLGPSCIAALSRPLDDRRALAYNDMEYWCDHGESVFRPWILLNRLRDHANFTYMGDTLALSFRDQDDSCELVYRHLGSGETGAVRARRVMLCAGAINSARIVANSLPVSGGDFPLLCNPYTYMPCVNLQMLGRQGRDRRHGLAQLFAYYREPQQAPEDGTSIQFYSYRSLLDFKLVNEMPLPPSLGRLLVRTIRESLVIIGIHHPDHADRNKYIRWRKGPADSLPEFEFVYERSADEKRRIHATEKSVARIARRLKLVPLRRMDPGYAASIHYAGTLAKGAGYGGASGDRVCGFKHVYSGDSASWNFLPAKGLSMTIMANAVRVAKRLAAEIR